MTSSAQRNYHGRPCHYCGELADTADHVVAKSRGGSRYRWNMVPACFACNHEKADSWPTCGCEFCYTAVRRTFIDNLIPMARVEMSAELTARQLELEPVLTYRPVLLA